MKRVITLLTISLISLSGCDQGGSSKKRKSSSGNAQPQQQQQQSEPQYNSGDGMVGSINQYQPQSNQAQNSSGDLIQSLLGGGGGFMQIIQQLLGGSGGQLNPNMLSQLQGMGGAGGLDINALMKMLPSLQGMDLNALLNQSGQQKATGLRNYEFDGRLISAIDLAASLSPDLAAPSNYHSLQIECRNTSSTKHLISVQLVSDEKTYFATRLLACDEFSIKGVADGTYELSAATVHGSTSETVTFVDAQTTTTISL